MDRASTPCPLHLSSSGTVNSVLLPPLLPKARCVLMLASFLLCGLDLGQLMLAADELTYLGSRHMSAPPRLQDCSTRGTKSIVQRGTLCRNQLTQSRRAEISPSSCETPLAIVAISSLSVGEDGPLGVAVALADGQEVTFDGNGAVENVVGSGGQPELQCVRWKWCVHLVLVVLEFKVDVCADVVQWGVGSEDTLARSTTFDSNACISSTSHPIRL